VQVRDDHLCPGLSEAQRDRLAEPLASAGDQGPLAAHGPHRRLQLAFSSDVLMCTLIPHNCGLSLATILPRPGRGGFIRMPAVDHQPEERDMTVNTNAFLRCEVKGLRVTVHGIDKTVELPRVGSVVREIDGEYYVEVRCHWVSEDRKLPIV